MLTFWIRSKTLSKPFEVESRPFLSHFRCKATPFLAIYISSTGFVQIFFIWIQSLARLYLRHFGCKATPFSNILDFKQCFCSIILDLFLEKCRVQAVTFSQIFWIQARFSFKHYAFEARQNVKIFCRWRLYLRHFERVHTKTTPGFLLLLHRW